MKVEEDKGPPEPPLDCGDYLVLLRAYAAAMVKLIDSKPDSEFNADDANTISQNLNRMKMISNSLTFWLDDE